MKIARVFPRKTAASPGDGLAFFGAPDLFAPEVDEVRVSVTWVEDKALAEGLANQWRHVAPVKVGGPAYDDRGDDFTPGMYLRPGYVFTSRGCPNDCWFCSVPKREGDVRELPITDGWNLLDSNILACSEDHIRKVFEMLKRQDMPVELTGGLEAARLDDWRMNMLWDLRPNQMFFAYDTPDDLEPLVEAGRKLRRADFTRWHCRCYVLIGYPKDTPGKAVSRLMEVWDAGFMPMAMMWRGKSGNDEVSEEWAKVRRSWIRPAKIKAEVKRLFCKLEEVHA